MKKQNIMADDAHAQISNTYNNSNLSKNSTKCLRAFMGQSFKGHFFGIIKNHNGKFLMLIIRV